MLGDPQEGPYFCLVPWVHAEIHQSGEVYPCCRMNHAESCGSLKQQSFAELWNSPYARDVRQAMLKGEAFADCRDCYAREARGELSSRQAANSRFAAYRDRVAETRADGTAPLLPLPSLDIRFSNLCNFSCRICDVGASTGWYRDYNALHPGGAPIKEVIRPTETREELWALLDTYFPQLERVYFAGGEPLLEEDHYLFLERLIARGRTNVALAYNTNLSSLSRGDRHIFQYWKHFAHIDLSVSLDGAGPALGYLRKGARWEEIVANLRQTRVLFPQVQISLMPTISVLNAFHIAEAFFAWARAGILTEQTRIVSNLLIEPRHLNLVALTQPQCTELRDHYAEQVARHRGEVSPAVATQIERQLDFIVASLPRAVDPAARAEFLQRTEALDGLRAERLTDHFPELI